MKSIGKKLLATTFALAMVVSALISPAGADSYPTSGNWDLYYYPSAERVNQKFNLVYSGNGYTGEATRIDGSCSNITVLVDVGGVEWPFTRAGISHGFYPQNNGNDYVIVDVAMNMGGGTSAISEGTVARN